MILSNSSVSCKRTTLDLSIERGVDPDLADFAIIFRTCLW